MPQMGPMKWLVFLFVMLILIMIFVIMVHDAELKKIELEESKEVSEKVKKW